MIEYIQVCNECGRPCTIQEISFGYAGTHCTHGVSGTYYTGDFESSCCGADFHEEFISDSAIALEVEYG
jgi:hypothetical protein